MLISEKNRPAFFLCGQSMPNLRHVQVSEKKADTDTFLKIKKASSQLWKPKYNIQAYSKYEKKKKHHTKLSIWYICKKQTVALKATIQKKQELPRFPTIFMTACSRPNKQNFAHSFSKESDQLFVYFSWYITRLLHGKGPYPTLSLVTTTRLLQLDNT